MRTRTNTKIIFGIDVGGTTIKAGLFLEDGTLLENYEFPTNKRNHGAHILDEIAGFIKGVLIEKSIPSEEVLGIGIGVPGAVTKDGIVNRCVNIGWDIVPVKKRLEEKTGFLVEVGNDATVAALGEYWRGSGNGFSHIALITIGTGIGGGIIVNGSPVYGSFGAGGELGHMPIGIETEEVCNCGKRGCLEQVASASGLVRIAKKILKESDTSSVLRNLSDLNAKNIMDAGKKQDAIALEATKIMCEYLGRAMACISAIVDPGCILIGGGVSAAGEYLLHMLSQSYRRNVFFPSIETQIRLASLGNKAGIYGAAKLIIDSYEKELDNE